MFFSPFLLLSISLQFYLFTEAVCATSTTLLKMRLWYRCFHVNFAKFLRTSFSHNSSGRLLLSSPSNLLFITNLSKSLFLLFNISTFYVFFQKTCSNLARECEISDDNRKKNEWKFNTSNSFNTFNFSTIKGKRWKLSSLLKYTIQFLHFHLIKSI